MSYKITKKALAASSDTSLEITIENSKIGIPLFIYQILSVLKYTSFALGTIIAVINHQRLEHALSYTTNRYLPGMWPHANTKESGTMVPLDYAMPMVYIVVIALLC